MKNIIEETKNKILRGSDISADEAILLSETGNTEMLLYEADQLRKIFNGNVFDLCSIMNAKSGRCSENCVFCAQSAHFGTNVREYGLITPDDALKLARENEAAGVKRFSLVTSGRTISEKDLEKLLDIYRLLARETGLILCASHGLLTIDMAKELKRAGVHTYHHNLEAGEKFFPNVCTTHIYDERIKTIKNATQAGLNVCSGGIIGLGEEMSDRIDMAIAIRSLGVRSVPVNILIPVKGTPLENRPRLDPEEILRTLAVFRFIFPSGNIRIAGGRITLGEEQGTGLRSGINAAIVGNYLTTTGGKINDDIIMVKNAGFEI